MNQIASGDTTSVARAVKNRADAYPQASILVFDDDTSQTVEWDLRGSIDDVLQRLAPAPSVPAQAPAPSVGRPKLGVVAREVTLLPRHWEWLGQQPGGASVALRKLVEAARKANPEQAEAKRRQEVTYKFMSTMAGDLPGFEEASRALFAGNMEAFTQQLAAWPADIRAHTLKLHSGS